jgi:hypothetical protein
VFPRLQIVCDDLPNEILGRRIRAEWHDGIVLGNWVIL